MPRGSGPENGLVIKARECLNTLHAYVRSYGKDRSRIRRLVAFTQRHYVVKTAEGEEHKTDEKSSVRHGDRLEIEHYLKRRDVVDELDITIASLDKKIRDIEFNPETADAIHRLVTKRDNLEEKRLKHLAAMEHMLDNLSKEQDRGALLMAKIASDGAKLAQAATQHVDKMEIARETLKEPSETELLARIAAKHGVTVEQAQAILGAKTIDAESDDG